MLELTVKVPVLQLDPLGLRPLESAGHCVGWGLHALIWLLEWGVMQVMLCCRNILERMSPCKKKKIKTKHNTIQPGIKETSQKQLITTKQSLLPILEWITLWEMHLCVFSFMNYHFSLVEYWGVFYVSVGGDSGLSLADKPSNCSFFRTLGFFLKM